MQTQTQGIIPVISKDVDVDLKTPHTDFAYTIYQPSHAQLFFFFEKLRRLVEEEKVEYAIQGFESCPTTGTLHGQGYVKFSKPVSFFTVKRLLNPAHVEVTREIPSRNIEYCRKSGTFITSARPKYFDSQSLGL